MSDETKVEPAVTPAPEVPAEETKDDPNARVAAFVKEYGELVAKHRVDFIHYPLWQPDGEPGGWRMTMQIKAVDTKSLPQKSPFVAQ